jgi:hypothetical protein
MIVSDKLERNFEEVAVVYYKVLSKHLIADSEKPRTVCQINFFPYRIRNWRLFLNVSQKGIELT